MNETRNKSRFHRIYFVFRQQHHLAMTTGDLGYHEISHQAKVLLFKLI